LTRSSGAKNRRPAPSLHVAPAQHKRYDSVRHPFEQRQATPLPTTAQCATELQPTLPRTTTRSPAPDNNPVLVVPRSYPSYLPISCSRCLSCSRSFWPFARQSAHESLCSSDSRVATSAPRPGTGTPPPGAAHPIRPAALGLAVAHLAELAIGDLHRQAQDRPHLASARASGCYGLGRVGTVRAGTRFLRTSAL
jgi:hypothetical protein